MELMEKVVFVTGAGSGIGRAAALKLAEEGAAVGLCDLDETGAQETARMITEAGGQATAVTCDVTRSDEVQQAVAHVVETFGKLDGAVNNAGVGGTMANVDQVEEATWDSVLNVNLKGVWLCMKYEIPHLLAQGHDDGGSAIVNVASVAGLVGFRRNAVYAASKHGVVGLTKSAALEYARRGLRINAVCPGFTQTPMVDEMVDEMPQMAEITQRSSPMRRLGRAEEVADAILYLLSDASSFVNGHALALDGGASAG